MNHNRYPAKRDSLFGWLSEFSDQDWFPKNGFHDDSSLSIYEDETSVCVEAALPGLKSDEVEVLFEKGMLWIRGHKKEEEGDKHKKFYRKAVTEFSYNVHVPGHIDERAEPEATFKNGVMKVVFRKHEKTQPRKIHVKGS